MIILAVRRSLRGHVSRLGRRRHGGVSHCPVSASCCGRPFQPARALTSHENGRPSTLSAADFAIAASRDYKAAAIRAAAGPVYVRWRRRDARAATAPIVRRRGGFLLCHARWRAHDGQEDRRVAKRGFLFAGKCSKTGPAPMNRRSSQLPAGTSAAILNVNCATSEVIPSS